MTPIIIKNPKVLLQPLTALGADDGAAEDVSCDLGSLELSPDTPMIDVTTFCGTFTLPDDVSIECTLGAVINADTSANWAPLVGKTVRVEVKDRSTDTKFRKFTSVVPFDPSLYGPTTPGEARAFDFNIPVLSAVEWDEES